HKAGILTKQGGDHQPPGQVARTEPAGRWGAAAGIFRVNQGAQRLDIRSEMGRILPLHWCHCAGDVFFLETSRPWPILYQPRSAFVSPPSATRAIAPARFRSRTPSRALPLPLRQGTSIRPSRPCAPRPAAWIGLPIAERSTRTQPPDVAAGWPKSST